MKRMLLALGLLVGCGSTPPVDTYDMSQEADLLRPKHSCCCTKRELACRGNCGCGCESCYNAVKHGD